METIAAGGAVTWVLVALALVYGFSNGYNDAAGAIGPLVSTGVMRPSTAVAWIATGQLVAGLVFGLALAATVAHGLVEPSMIDRAVIAGALLAALTWTVGTARFGLPSSASHALLGGLIGAALARGGFDALIGPGVLMVVAGLVLAPLAAALVSIATVLAVSWLFARSSPRRVDRGFERLQVATSALRALGHGAVDAQKTVGVLWLLLAGGAATSLERMPGWVVGVSYGALSLGTLLGGWRIVRAMGLRRAPLRPPGGVAADLGAATLLLAAAVTGVPISASQTTAGGVVGAASVRKFSAARWGVAGRIVFTWVFTLPAAAVIAALGWAITDRLL